MVGAALVIPRLKSRMAREIVAAILPLAMSLQVLFVFAGSALSVQRSLSISGPAQHVAPRREPASEILDRPGRFLVCLRPAFRRRAVPLRYALAGSEHRFAGASRRRLHHDDGRLSA
jgi:hypothetical protein